MYQCLATERCLGARVSELWWDQGNLDMERIREAERVAEAERC